MPLVVNRLRALCIFGSVLLCCVLLLNQSDENPESSPEKASIADPVDQEPPELPPGLPLPLPTDQISVPKGGWLWFWDIMCHHLRNGTVGIDAIGHYGGASGAKRFLVLTTNGVFWADKASNMFSQQETSFFRIVLPSITHEEVLEQWPKLEGLYSPQESHKDGALLRFENEDLLIFRLSTDALMNVSLNDRPAHKSLPSGGNPILTQDWAETEKIQLISAVPSGKLLALKYFRGKGNGDGDYCLIEFNLIVDGKENSKKAENFRSLGCIDKAHFIRFHRGFFYRRQDIGRLYGFNNVDKCVYEYHVWEGRLLYKNMFTYLDFFQCDDTRKFTLKAVFFLLGGILTCGCCLGSCYAWPLIFTKQKFPRKVSVWLVTSFFECCCISCLRRFVFKWFCKCCCGRLYRKYKWADWFNGAEGNQEEEVLEDGRAPPASPEPVKKEEKKVVKKTKKEKKKEKERTSAASPTTSDLVSGRVSPHTTSTTSMTTFEQQKPYMQFDENFKLINSQPAFNPSFPQQGLFSNAHLNSAVQGLSANPQTKFIVVPVTENQSTSPQQQSQSPAQTGQRNFRPSAPFEENFNLFPFGIPTAYRNTNTSRTIHNQRQYRTHW